MRKEAGSSSSGAVSASDIARSTAASALVGWRSNSLRARTDPVSARRRVCVLPPAAPVTVTPAGTVAVTGTELSVVVPLHNWPELLEPVTRTVPLDATCAEAGVRLMAAASDITATMDTRELRRSPRRWVRREVQRSVGSGRLITTLEGQLAVAEASHLSNGPTSSLMVAVTSPSLI